MSGNRQRSNWSDFYSKAANVDTNRGAIWNSQYNVYDKAVNEVAGQEVELLNFYLANQGNNFTLIPSHKKWAVQFVHNCFSSEDSDGSQSVIGLKWLVIGNFYQAISLDLPIPCVLLHF